MKFRVGLFVDLAVFGVMNRLAKRREQFAKLLQLVGIDESGGLLRGETLQSATNFECLLHILHGQVRDKRAATRADIDEAFGGQLLNGIPYRE